MNFAEEAQKHLVSTDSSEIMKGLGFALLALTQEMTEKKKHVDTTTRRKPQSGDVMTLHCGHCNKDVQAHALSMCEDILWICPECQYNLIEIPRRSD
jgi:hypothetical protein